jgi:hypothetical protein
MLNFIPTKVFLYTDKHVLIFDFVYSILIITQVLSILFDVDLETFNDISF